MELLDKHGPKQRAALMRRNSKYVGLDVHQAMTAATVRTEGGRVIARSVMETSERSITEFFRSEEHTSELQSRRNLVCRLLLEKKKKKHIIMSLKMATEARQ